MLYKTFFLVASILASFSLLAQKGSSDDENRNFSARQMIFNGISFPLAKDIDAFVFFESGNIFYTINKKGKQQVKERIFYNDGDTPRTFFNLIIEDYNFDGINDFSIKSNDDRIAQSTSDRVFIYSSKESRFIYYDDVFDLVIDRKNKRIWTTCWEMNVPKRCVVKIPKNYQNIGYSSPIQEGTFYNENAPSEINQETFNNVYFSLARGISATIGFSNNTLNYSIVFNEKRKNNGEFPYDKDGFLTPVFMRIDDYNFDGLLDFSFVESDGRMGVNDVYRIFIYSKKDNRFTPYSYIDGNPIFNLVVDKKRKRLLVTCWSSLSPQPRQCKVNLPQSD
jgi:hypothetical protein